MINALIGIDLHVLQRQVSIPKKDKDANNPHPKYITI